MGKLRLLSPEKLRIARAALLDGATQDAVAKLVDVSKPTIGAAVKDGRLPRSFKAVERERAIAQNQRLREAGVPVESVVRPPKLSQKADIDRNKRAEAADHRTFTQCFFGDPPPGYSALDGKTGQT